LRLARFWLAKADMTKAARHAEQALRLVRADPSPPTLPDDLAPTVEVALTAARVQRGLDHGRESRELLEWALSLLDAAPASPERDRLLATTLTDLGDCHRRAGRYPQAAQALRRALPLGQHAEPARYGATLMMLGIVAKELGAFEEAAGWYDQVAQLDEQAGALPGNAAALQHNLAGLAHARQQYALAETHARRAIELRRTVKRVRPADVAVDVAVLAAALAGQRRFDDARALYVDAMRACGRARPPRRYEIAVHLHSIAAIDQACGRWDAAEQGYWEALARREDLLGPEHPEIGLILNNLGTLLDDRGRPGEAAACYARAMALGQQAYPDDHPMLAAIRHNQLTE
jgi:tetratricopeptide (TPR) repeat protein